MLDRSAYRPIGDDWLIGITDIVNSGDAIRRGLYRDVNFAGVAIIAALGNVLGTFDFPFTFGGDGSAFAVAGTERRAAEIALVQVGNFVRQELGLEMRVGLIPVSQVRASGNDVRIAPYAASRNVTYTMFSGGGLRWAERQLKLGHIAPPPVRREGEASPDLSGLSCDWKPFANRNGTILSLLAAPRREHSSGFTDLARLIVAIFDQDGRNSSPVPERLPPRFSQGTVDPSVWAAAVLNSDFRKYDDVLRLTVDCSPKQVEAVKTILVDAEKRGDLTYGLHCQSHAIMTCVVPSSNPSAHRHFLDGMDGGYAMAAQMMRTAA